MSARTAAVVALRQCPGGRFTCTSSQKKDGVPSTVEAAAGQRMNNLSTEEGARRVVKPWR